MSVIFLDNISKLNRCYTQDYLTLDMSYFTCTSKEPVGSTWTGKQHNPKFFGQNGNNFLISAF